MLRLSKLLQKQNVLHIFPGQGTQQVGQMLPKNYKSFSNLFSQANEILEYDLEALMTTGPAERLNNTEFAQPAIFMSSHLNFLNKGKFDDADHDGDKDTVQHFAGYSLGEYNALVASGKLSFENAILLLKVRGYLMQKACNQTDSLLATVVKSGKSKGGSLKIDEILQQVLESDFKNTFNHENNANFLHKQQKDLYNGFEPDPNHPGHIKPDINNQDILEIAAWMSNNIFTVGGDVKPMQTLMKHKKEFGILAMKYLNVSGAFHTRIMRPAVEDFRDVINSLCSDKDPEIVKVAISQMLYGLGFLNVKGHTKKPYYNLLKQNIFTTNENKVYSNLTGQVYGTSRKHNKYPSEVEQIINDLPLQIENPVLWHQIIAGICKKESDFISVREYGPGDGQLGKLLYRMNQKMWRKYSYEFEN